MQANMSKCDTKICTELSKRSNLPLSFQGSHFLQLPSHRYSSHTLLRSRQLQWPLLNTHTVAFGVTLAYSPSVTSITIQQGPLTSQGFCTSPTSFCANCYSLGHCHNFLNYDIISYNLVTRWTEKETQLTCSTSFSKKYEIKLVPLLKKFPKSHYSKNIGS